MNMKYKTAKVVSHQRAGSHYLAKLLNDNFFHEKDYLSLYAGHSKGHYKKYPGAVIFYIYRNNRDTINSIYNLRNRFGLIADSIEEFKTKKLSNMHSTNIVSKAMLNDKIVTDVDTYFSTVHVTIEEYLEEHKKFWNTRADFIVNYDALIQNFIPCMKAIAIFLGSELEDFKNEREQIGWHDAQYDKKIFS